MKRNTVIKLVITFGIIALVLIAFHLVGSTMFPMIKNHMGL